MTSSEPAAPTEQPTCGCFIQYSDPEAYAACFCLELGQGPAQGDTGKVWRRYNLATTPDALVIRSGGQTAAATWNLCGAHPLPV